MNSEDNKSQSKINKMINSKLVILLLAAFFISCSEVKKTNVEDNKSNEIKEKELDLRERELDLKEKELAMKENNTSENLNSGIKGDYPEVSLITLTDQDLQNRDSWELRIMRNEVFARHGYIFKIPELREYFIRQNWYDPKFEDVNNMLSDLEKENVVKIRKYEEYTDSQYKGYSR